MLCSECNTLNPEQARFCLKCGARLLQVCPECATELPPHAEFCMSCGAKLGEVPIEAARVSPDGTAERLQRLVPREYGERLMATRGQLQDERRTVTILFCDVKGSTAMAEKLDPEEVKEIMDGAFEFLIPPVYRYEGTLTQLMGDAILAFFGAPIAHEDDPERAIRAALEIIAGAKQYAAKLEQERDIKGFNVRVGVNTGLVVVGELGSDLRVAYTAIGDAINLAARMETAAEPGTILITEATHKLIAPLFETESLGRIELKGKAEPVAVYRVLAAKGLPEKVRGIAGLESPLVGREQEFAALRKALERLEAGVGGIVTIVGEAGIGKSRLVAECRTNCKAVVRWVEGRCLSYGTSISYLVWLDVLRSLLGVTVEHSLEVVRDRLRARVQDLCADRFEDVYPYLARLMSLPLADDRSARLDEMDGQDLKASTFQAVQTLLGSAAGERPLAVVCEDLHWADSTSIEVLEHLLALTDRFGLLLICVFRPRKEHGSWRIQETAARTYGHRHADLWLEPLSLAEGHALVENLLQIEDLPSKLKERILNVAEGNPFYVEEIVRSLIDQQLIGREETTSRWQAARDVEDIPIPNTLQGVLVARIDRLQEDTKRVLQMASVIGRVFLYRVLEAIAGEERQLDQHLLTLQREEMIRERARIPELAYIFKHELTREAAYNGLLKKERRVHHGQIAEALERLFPDRSEEQAGLLAYHWERSGDEGKAATYLLKAGDQARSLYAHSEAEEFYQKALKTLRKQGDREQTARTLMKLGLVYTASFEPEKAQEAYDEAFSLWELPREGAATPESNVPAAVLRFAVAEPLSLDPGAIDDDMSAFIAVQLFEGLVEVDPDYNVIPAVASRWEVSDDGRTYTFVIRDGLAWSDGTPLTANDFEYTWKRNLGMTKYSPAGGLLNVVRNARALREGKLEDPEQVGVVALDDLTLEVSLEAPTAYLPHLLAHNIAYPLLRRAMEKHGEAWAEPGNLISNGPYRLVQWERGKRLILTRNPFYRRPFLGNATRVECVIFTDFGSALQAYGANAIDGVSMIAADPDTIGRAKATYGRELVLTLRLSTFYLAFRTDCPPFNDARVRRAFVHAVDREALARDAFHDRGLPATGGFVPPGMPAHSPGAGLAYDPDRARRLMAEAGYADGVGFPAVTWLHLASSQNERVVPFLKESWLTALGVALQAQGVEWEVLMERGNTDPPHLALVGWSADYPDPDSFLRVSTTRRCARWHSALYEELVEEAARVTDQARRIELYRKADRILVTEEAVIMPLMYVQGSVLVKPWVTLPGTPPSLMPFKDIIVRKKGDNHANYH